VGEPTSLKLAVSQRGLLLLDCLAKGKAAHVAHKNSGDNAILKAVEDISRLQKLNFDKISPYLGRVELEVTQIDGGIQYNMIPDKCSFVVDIRTNELYTHDEIVDIISKEITSEIIPRSLRLKSSFISEYHSFIVKAKGMGVETIGSKILSDMALIPCPSVKIGPGDSLRSHKPDEFILKEEIIQAIQLYYNLLHNYQF
jgi:acetylornithine deacetylase